MRQSGSIPLRPTKDVELKIIIEMFGICDLNSIFVVFTPRTRHISLSKWVYFYAHLKAYITKI